MKRFDAEKFFRDYSISNQTSGNKHCRPGWIQIHCPFCRGSQNYHLGVHPETGAWNCWRCGKKKLWDVLKLLLGPNPTVIGETIGRYGSKVNRPVAAKVTPLRKGSVTWPSGILDDPPVKAIRYLKSRKFDPKELIETWGLKFTGPTGKYKFRILAPIYHDGRLVSYQGRDYTGNSELKYKACPKDEETRDHQHCLYGSWLTDGISAIVVEGIADAWRFGPGAVAVFGMSYTIAQVKLLCQFRNLWIVFDGEEEATMRAEALAASIIEVNPRINVSVVTLEGGDPGEMEQKEADKLKKLLIK